MKVFIVLYVDYKDPFRINNKIVFELLGRKVDYLYHHVCVSVSRMCICTHTHTYIHRYICIGVYIHKRIRSLCMYLMSCGLPGVNLPEFFPHQRGEERT